MTGTRTRLARLSVAAAAGAAIAFSSIAPAAGHGGSGAETDQERADFLAAGEPGPALVSDNVTWLGGFPDTAGISGDFAKSTEHFYVSSTDTLTVYDISNPTQPIIAGTLPNFVFENEAMNYGEQHRKGKLRQFIMVGADLAQASPGDLSHVNVDEPELIIVDVSDPSSPAIRGRTLATTSTHTVACVQVTSCRYAYSAGGRGRFSIFDLHDLKNPTEVDSNPDKKGI